MTTSETSPTLDRLRVSPVFPLLSFRADGTYIRYGITKDEDMDFYEVYDSRDGKVSVLHQNPRQAGRPSARVAGDMPPANQPMVSAPQWELAEAWSRSVKPFMPKGTPNPFSAGDGGQRVFAPMARAMASAWPEVIPPIHGIPFEEQRVGYKEGRSSGWSLRWDNLYCHATDAAYRRAGLTPPPRKPRPTTRKPNNPSIAEAFHYCLQVADGSAIPGKPSSFDEYYVKRPSRVRIDKALGENPRIIQMCRAHPALAKFVAAFLAGNVDLALLTDIDLTPTAEPTLRDPASLSEAEREELYDLMMSDDLNAVADIAAKFNLSEDDANEIGMAMLYERDKDMFADAEVDAADIDESIL